VRITIYTFPLLAFVIWVSTTLAFAGGPPPAKTLEEAFSFDFPVVPTGLSYKERSEYVGGGLHRLYDLVALGEYDLADAHWEKLMEYQEQYSAQLSRSMFHSILWRIGYGKGKAGEKTVAAYMYARALEVRRPLAMDFLDPSGEMKRGLFNEYLILHSNAVGSAVDAGWIQQAKLIASQAEDYLISGLNVNLYDASMPIYVTDASGKEVPMDYAMGNYLETRSEVSFVNGDLRDAEFACQWILKIWKAHVPKEKEIFDRGYDRNHYALDISACDASARLMAIYDLLREPEKSFDLGEDMIAQRRLDDLNAGSTMTIRLRAQILRKAQLTGFSESTLDAFNAVRVIPLDKKNEPHDPVKLGWFETGIKGEILWNIGREEEARTLFEERIEKLAKSTNAEAWSRLLLQYCRLRIQTHDNTPSVEKDLVALLNYCRERGIKPYEFDLYLLYAGWLENRGEYDRSLEMLAQARRIALFIGHASLIDLVDLRLAKVAALWNQQEAPATATAVSTSSNPTAPSDSPQAGRTELAVNATVDLQPISATVSAKETEFARARFTLTSLASAMSTGQLHFNAPEDTVIESDVQSGEVWVKLGAGSASAFRLPLALEALEQWQIFVEPNAQARLQAPLQFELQWQSAAGTQTSTATFTRDYENRTVHSVHQSLGARNAFYSTPFYHEIYFREEIPTEADVRIVASRECRLEYFNPLTFDLLAIDANGDGDFDDAGDVVYQDANSSGYPDMAIDGSAMIGYAEFQAYTEPSDTSIHFALELSTDNGITWSPLSTDELQFR